MPVTFGKKRALSVLAILILFAGCQKSADRAPFDADKVYTGADGRAYRLERLEKKPGGYSWVNKTMLRYYPHGFYEVEREDDAYFYVRQYVPVKVEPPAPEHAPPAVPVAPPASETFSWQPFDAGLPRAGQWRDNFAVADMNGDGFPDLVFAPTRKTPLKPVVYLGDGKGKWTLWTQARYPAAAYDYGGVAVADFNADGKQDIALGMHLLGFAVLSGDGKGGFSDDSSGLPRRKSGEQPTLSSRNVLAYDWNADGKPALVALNEHMGVDPTRGIHDGVVVFLKDKASWITLANEAPLQHAALMAIDASAKKLALIEAPTREGSVRISERQAGAWRLHDVDGFPKDALLTAFAVANDGADASTFVVAYRAYATSAWWTYVDLVRQRDGKWQRSPLSAQRDAAGVTALAFAKLRPGAFRDVVMLDENGETSILRQGKTEDAYTRDRSQPAPPWRAGCEGYGLRAVDLDKDGIDEIVVSFAGEGTVLTKPAAAQCTSGGGVQAFKISSKP